jgi:hypothetical protein
MYSVENPAGRLVTFRITTPVDDGNATSAATDLRAVVQSIEGRVIICTDLTEARTFAPATAQRFVAVMKMDNPKLERSALLLGPDAATVLLQMERMVREAASPDRRTFRSAQELTEWLQPLLTTEEQSALSVFLKDRQ